MLKQAPMDALVMENKQLKQRVAALEAEVQALSAKVSTSSADEVSLPALPSFPSHVAERIALKLIEIRDVLSLGTTCHFWNGITGNPLFWKQMVVCKFGTESLKTAEERQPVNYLELYSSLLSPVLPVAKFRVAWLNTPDNYLQLVHDPSSASRTVVKLNAVCWLDIVGEFHNVQPGSYDVLWSIKMDQHTVQPDPWELATWAGSERVVKRLTPPELMRFRERTGRNIYGTICAGQIKVLKQGVVRVACRDHSNFWKLGPLWLDMVQLKRMG